MEFSVENDEMDSGAWSAAIDRETEIVCKPIGTVIYKRKLNLRGNRPVK
jgi:hypothetical protein